METLLSPFQKNGENYRIFYGKNIKPVGTGRIRLRMIWTCPFQCETFDDCKKGLVSVVAGWHYDPGFEGQHKSKVNNQDFLKLGKDCIKSALGEYFQRNNGTLRKIIGILRKNVQVRMEAAKIKGTKLAKPKNALDFMGIAGFEDITDPNYTTAAEILVAAGSK